jgi:hypothetical protein
MRSTSPASLGIVCFRRRGPERVNEALVRDFEASGQGVVASTRIDVEQVVDFFAARTGQPASSSR